MFLNSVDGRLNDGCYQTNWKLLFSKEATTVMKLSLEVAFATMNFHQCQSLMSEQEKFRGICKHEVYNTRSLCMQTLFIKLDYWIQMQGTLYIPKKFQQNERIIRKMEEEKLEIAKVTGPSINDWGRSHKTE